MRSQKLKVSNDWMGTLFSGMFLSDDTCHFMDMSHIICVCPILSGFQGFLAVMQMLQWILLSVRGGHRVDLAKHVWRVQGGEHGDDGGDGGDGNGGGGGEHNDQDADPTATLICDDY